MIPKLTIVALFCLNLLLITPINSVMAQNDGDYESQLKKLELTIKELQKELAKTKTSRDKLQASLQKSEQEASSLTTKIEAIQEDIESQKKRLAQHQSQRAELEESKRVQQDEVNIIIRQAYLLGGQNQLKLLLNQEEPSKIIRLLRYNDYILKAHKEKLDEYLTTITTLRSLEVDIASTTERLETQRSQLSLRYQDLKQSQTDRLTTINKLTQTISSKGDSLSQYTIDRQRLERLLEEATRSLTNLKLPSDAKPFRSVKGKLPYPSKGLVKNSFGSFRPDGKQRWNGLFIKDSAGSSVVSVHYGRVIFSDYLRGHGLLLIIDHGDGYMSLYAHNQALLKETGDWVSSNETIAIVGNTGGQAQAGLYFEIRHNGKPQNPSPWLDRNKRG